MKLLCRLGLHKWDLWMPRELMQLIDDGWEWQHSRRCVRCDHVQVAITRKVEAL